MSRILVWCIKKKKAQTPGASSLGQLYMYTMATYIFGIIFAVFMRT